MFRRVRISACCHVRRVSRRVTPAIRMQRLIEPGEVHDYADLAGLGQVTGTLERCNLEPTDHHCQPADRHAPEFRILETFNNIRVEERGKPAREHNEEGRARIVVTLQSHKTPSVSTVRKAFGIHRKAVDQRVPAILIRSHACRCAMAEQERAGGLAKSRPRVRVAPSPRGPMCRRSVWGKVPHRRTPDRCHPSRRRRPRPPLADPTLWSAGPALNNRALEYAVRGEPHSSMVVGSSLTIRPNVRLPVRPNVR